ncbi:hypothetical protein, partial [Thiolapillus sp.]
MFSLWRKARRENSAASRLLGSTSLRFALHGWQRRIVSKRPRIHTYFPHLTLCRLSPRIPRQRRKQWILPISPKARR